nr:hypothetical protein [Tanacetum cinerariifolium]
MRILSVIRIKVFFMYGYDYMKKIVLRHANLNEHVIMERDFKYLYLSDFEDLNLLNLQGHLNHLPPKDKKILTKAVNQWTRQRVIRQRVEDFQLGIESYQTQVNLTKPQWTATGFEYKHDYTVIESPTVVIFRDKYGDQQDESRFKYKVLDQEGCRSVQHIHVRDSEAFEDTENLPQPGELCWRTCQRGRLQTFKAWQSAPASGHSKSKCTIESRAKRSSKIISLGYDSTLLASSHTVKSKTDIKSPTHYPCVGFNSLVHSLHALSALRRSGLRTASTAAKPCQGDSSEFYLITGSIHTDQRGTVILVTLFNGSKQRHFRSVITYVNLQEHRRL